MESRPEEGGDSMMKDQRKMMWMKRRKSLSNILEISKLHPSPNGSLSMPFVGLFNVISRVS